MKAKNREARNRWDRENMKVLSCKVRKELAEEFAEVCRELGTSPNAVFRETLMYYLSMYRAKCWKPLTGMEMSEPSETAACIAQHRMKKSHKLIDLEKTD